MTPFRERNPQPPRTRAVYCVWVPEPSQVPSLTALHGLDAQQQPTYPDPVAVEQVDWAAVARHTADNDFAAAALFLLGRLGVVDDGPGIDGESEPGTGPP